MKFILRWLAIAIGTYAAIRLVPGIYPIGDNGYIAVAAFSLALAFINSVIKPVVQFLSLPFTIITLGIFYLVVNALLLNLASWLSLNIFPSGIMVATFSDGFVGAIIISIISAIINAITGAGKSSNREG